MVSQEPLLRYRHSWRKRMRFWLVALVLCAAAAGAAMGVTYLLQAPGQSKFLKYQPVDLAPPELAPKHEGEYKALERQEKAIERQKKESERPDR